MAARELGPVSARRRSCCLVVDANRSAIDSSAVFTSTLHLVNRKSSLTSTSSIERARRCSTLRPTLVSRRACGTLMYVAMPVAFEFLILTLCSLRRSRTRCSPQASQPCSSTTHLQPEATRVTPTNEERTTTYHLLSVPTSRLSPCVSSPLPSCAFEPSTNARFAGCPLRS